MQAGGILLLPALLGGQGLADRFGIELAHQLADVLQLAAVSFVGLESACELHRLKQGLGQGNGA